MPTAPGCPLHPVSYALLISSVLYRWVDRDKVLKAYLRMKERAARRNRKRKSGITKWNPQIGDLRRTGSPRKGEFDPCGIHCVSASAKFSGEIQVGKPNEANFVCL
jgi:hypothetical protein